MDSFISEDSVAIILQKCYNNSKCDGMETGSDIILLENKNNSYAYFNKMFFIKFKIQNIFISYIKRQLDKLNLDKEYIEAKKLYALEKNGKNKSKSLKKYTSIMNDRIKYLGLTKDSLEKYSKKIQKRYKKYISSQVAQVIANNTYQSLFDLF